MIGQETLLVTLVRLVNRIRLVTPVKQRRRGRPATYPDRLFLQALVIMIVRHLYTVHELLSVLAEPTAEMQRFHYRTENMFENRAVGVDIE